MRNFIIFLIPLIADRFTKFWAFHTLSDSAVPVCYGWNFVLAWNRGVSWNLFATDDQIGFWLLTSCIALIITCFAIYTWKRASLSDTIFFEMFVLAGALSNLIDRFWYGAVLDFIQWYVKDFYWPVFNIADASIMIGIGGIILRTWWGFDERDDKKFL